MSVFYEKTIRELYERNLALAKAKLTELPVHCGHVPNFGGLNGWVFEQTIQYCLQKEIEAEGIKPTSE